MKALSLLFIAEQDAFRSFSSIFAHKTCSKESTIYINEFQGREIVKALGYLHKVYVVFKVYGLKERHGRLL